MSEYSDDFEDTKQKRSTSKGKAGKFSKDSEEYKAALELELWKRSEEAKFKAHLKQVELETIENVTKEWRVKEQKRDDQLVAKIRELEEVEKKIIARGSKSKTKMQELQRREGKIMQVEGELQHKILEVSRQLGTKEEEIINIKKRFKEEKLVLQADIKSYKKQVETLKETLDNVENTYRNYRREMDESPVNVMRTEINNKNLEIADFKARLEKANEEIAASGIKFKKLRSEHTKLRREIERMKTEEKEKQAEELEKLKMEQRNIHLAQQDKQQILMLQEELTKVNEALMRKQEEEENKQMYLNTVSESTLQVQNNMQTVKSNPFEMRNTFKSTGNNAGSPSRQQKGKSKLEELQIMRRDLIESCSYNQEDEFIRDLDKQIRNLENLKSPNRDARA